jgi:hypothetical protein
MPDSNARNISCQNGHTFEVDAQATSNESLACPECGCEVENDAPSPGPARSLWEVMGQPGDDSVSQSAQSSESDSSGAAGGAAADNEDASPETEQPEDEPEVTERPRGLWAMMGASQPATEPSEAAEDSADVFEEAVDEFKEASSDDSDLFGSDTKTESADDSAASDGQHEPDEDEAKDSEQDGLESDDDLELADDDEEDGWEVESPLHDLDAADQSLSDEESDVDAPKQPTLPRGIGAVAAGILSVLLAGLNLLPSFGAKIPATIVGAYALLLGYQTLNSNRRLRESVPQMLAPVGMFLGLVGIFAGPAYLNELGDSWRNRSTKEVIEANLGSISKALSDYSIEKGSFPAGGTFTVDEAGLEVGMHGWMTTLLPYLGHMEIYDSIELSKPWNDEANTPAMSRPIPTFLIPSVPHEPTGRGFAIAHYAGVGGLIQTDQGLLPTGIFEKNSKVRIEEVSDGMSQTLIAGEIARALPAWGDPENWRTIEGPLNVRLSSFGNASGTGAHFLKGDGSVRFFSNKTSPDVLQKLATRDGGD